VCRSVPCFSWVSLPMTSGGGDDPSQAKAGSQRLRECAQVNDVADGIPLVAAQVLAINHDQGREMFAFIAELAVRIIF